MENRSSSVTSVCAGRKTKSSTKVSPRSPCRVLWWLPSGTPPAGRAPGLPTLLVDPVAPMLPSPLRRSISRAQLLVPWTWSRWFQTGIPRFYVPLRLPSSLPGWTWPQTSQSIAGRRKSVAAWACPALSCFQHAGPCGMAKSHVNRNMCINIHNM